MDQHFRSLLLGNTARNADRLALSFRNISGALGAGAFDCPSIRMGYNMLITFRHIQNPFKLKWLMLAHQPIASC